MLEAVTNVINVGEGGICKEFRQPSRGEKKNIIMDYWMDYYFTNMNMFIDRALIIPRRIRSGFKEAHFQAQVHEASPYLSGVVKFNCCLFLIGNTSSLSKK